MDFLSKQLVGHVECCFVRTYWEDFAEVQKCFTQFSERFTPQQLNRKNKRFTAYSVLSRTMQFWKLCPKTFVKCPKRFRPGPKKPGTFFSKGTYFLKKFLSTRKLKFWLTCLIFFLQNSGNILPITELGFNMKFYSEESSFCQNDPMQLWQRCLKNCQNSIYVSPNFKNNVS